MPPTLRVVAKAILGSRGVTVGSALAISLSTTLVAVRSQVAEAVILPAVTIDGPSQDIVGFGGVAMSEDGTGGLVYLKRVEGVAHVFVARYVGGRWQAPIRVDTAQRYAASWPRIGAADDGQLLVIWATPIATENTRPVEELLSAMIGPGASAFGPAKLVDPDIRFGTGASLDLTMSSTGQADVVYRVLEETPGEPSPIPLLRAGDVVEQVRFSYFEGETWSRPGAINRDSGVSMRSPTPANAPEVAVGPTGKGVVVWQEPDINGVARIWARRVFGRTLDYVLPVSAPSVSGAAINDDADAPSVTISPLGQAEVAYRQGAGPGSPLPGPRIFLNVLPDGESADGSQFAGATIVDPTLSGGAAATVGPPAIDGDPNNDVRLLYDANGAPRVIENDIGGSSETLPLGLPFSAPNLAAASVMNPLGGGISAWPSGNANGPGVAVREDFPGRGVQTAVLRGGRGGPIEGLAVGRSGLGDGLIGFMQGSLGDAAILAAQATAPPARFFVTVPSGWVNAAHAVISWSPAPTINGPVRYAVNRDGRVLQAGSGTLRLRLDRRGLGSGSHSIQVLATDADGQATLTAARQLKVDDQPPVVRLQRARGGGAVVLSVLDRYSGVNARAVSVSFGDGQRAGGRRSYRHRYARPGIYTIVVHAADRVGNRGVIRRPVKVT